MSKHCEACVAAIVVPNRAEFEAVHASPSIHQFTSRQSAILPFCQFLQVHGAHRLISNIPDLPFPLETFVICVFRGF